MAEHTPGPWTVDTPPDDYLVIRSSEGRHICTSIDCWANARLIAAAPEMFDALREATATLACIDPALQSTIEPSIEQARAALAKATGREVDRFGQPAGEAADA